MVEKLSSQQNVQLNKYLKAHPKTSRNAAIQLLFGNKGKNSANSKGLNVEHNTKGAPKPDTIYLQSGRKVVYTRTKDGKLACKYYGADGTPIKAEYFKKVEGNISISADNNSYTITKNGKSIKHAAKNPRKAQIDQNIVKLNNQEKSLKKTKKEQGFIGKSWDWFKNTTAGQILNLDGSNKAQKQIESERKLLVQLRDNPNAQIDPKKFEKVTGQKYTKANLTKFQQGEFSSAKAKVDAYKEGQTIAVDVASDIVSGAISFGIYSAAVAAAPFTGGASIAVGVAAAEVAGAATKIAIKAANTIGTNRKYDLFSKEAAGDALMGSVNGLLAPLTAGAGGAVAKTLAIRGGVQVVKETGKQATKQVLSQATKNAVKQGLGRTFKSQLKESIIHPNNYKLVGGTLGKRLTAYGAEGVVDGGLSGGVYSGVETAKNGGSAGDILKATAIGFGTGAFMGGIMTSAAHGKGIVTGNKGVVKNAGEELNDAVETSLTKKADNVAQTPKPQGVKSSERPRKPYEKPTIERISIESEDDIMAAPAPKPQGAERKPHINDLDFDDLEWNEIFTSATESTPHATTSDSLINPVTNQKTEIENLIDAKSPKLYLDNILKNAKTIDDLEIHLKQAETPEAKAIIAKRIEERKTEVLKAYDDFKAGKSVPDYKTTEDIVRIKIEDCKTLEDIENLTNDLRLRDRKVAEMNLDDYGAGAGSDMLRAKSKSIRTNILNDFTSRIERVNTKEEIEALKQEFSKFKFSDNYYPNLSSNDEMRLLYEQVNSKINAKLKSFELDFGYDTNNANTIKIDDLDFDEIIRKALDDGADI